jgi:hypothetical protein
LALGKETAPHPRKIRSGTASISQRSAIVNAPQRRTGLGGEGRFPWPVVTGALVKNSVHHPCNRRISFTELSRSSMVGRWSGRCVVAACGCGAADQSLFTPKCRFNARSAAGRSRPAVPAPT